MENGRPDGSILRGFGLCALCNLVLYPLAVWLISLIAPDFSLILILCIGLVQLVYLIPLMILYGRRGMKPMVQGLLIGGGITFLVNGSCWGLVVLSIGNMH